MNNLIFLLLYFLGLREKEEQEEQETKQREAEERYEEEDFWASHPEE
jgi:hypothetical protein